MNIPYTPDELRSMGMSKLVDAFPNGYDFRECLYLADERTGAEGECCVLCRLGILRRSPDTFDGYLAARGFDPHPDSEILP